MALVGIGDVDFLGSKPALKLLLARAAPHRLDGAEPDRQILALDQCTWPDKTTELKVLVQRSGIVVITPVRAVK